MLIRRVASTGFKNSLSNMNGQQNKVNGQISLEYDIIDNKYCLWNRNSGLYQTVSVTQLKSLREEDQWSHTLTVYYGVIS